MVNRNHPEKFSRNTVQKYMTKYYDITESGSSIVWFFGIGLAVLVGCVIIWIRFLVKRASLADKTKMGLLILLPLIWTAIVGAPFSSYVRARAALKNGTYEVVEGKVAHFSPIPMGDHGSESFSVNGIPFEYSEAKIDFGFSQSRIKGGPIYQGKQVQIHYFKGRILRLWVCDTCAFDPDGVEWKE